MARILVVGCGCRGRALCRGLVADGHAVRGTTRDPKKLADIEAAGAEGVVCDPNRLATLTPALAGISAICWLMASAAGDAQSIEALHRDRLSSLVSYLVDSPVRGVIYEARGSVRQTLLEQTAESLRATTSRHHMPAEVVSVDPSLHLSWIEAMRSAVSRVLA
jgi:uncharacterized protein YbjT (DUF2867 family)